MDRGRRRAMRRACQCDQVAVGSGAVRNPGLLGIYSRLSAIEQVRGDRLFHQAAVLSGIYRSESSNLYLLSLGYHFTNDIGHTGNFTDDRTEF